MTELAPLHQSMEEDVVFPFDSEKIISFNTQLAQAQWCVSPCTCPCAMINWYWYGQANLENLARGQTVKLGRTGITYTREPWWTACQWDCYKQGRTMKTIPLDKVTDVRVVDPAGVAFCCCIDNVLSQAFVETASSPLPEMTLVGLKDAHGFRDAVLARKDHRDDAKGSPGGGGIHHMKADKALELAEEQVSLLRSIDRHLAEIASKGGAEGR